jgi:hypothetical protein
MVHLARKCYFVNVKVPPAGHYNRTALEATYLMRGRHAFCLLINLRAFFVDHPSSFTLETLLTLRIMVGKVVEQGQDSGNGRWAKCGIPSCRLCSFANQAQDPASSLI